MRTTRRLVITAMLTAFALALSYAEGLLPPLLVFAPGVKIGLCNVAIFLALVVLSVQEAFAVALLKCLFMAFISGFSTLMFSVPATLAALITEAVLVKLLMPRVGAIAINIIGAIVFNIVQLAVIAAIATTNFFRLLPLFAVAGLIAGAITGTLSYFTLKHLPVTYFNLER